MSGGFRWPHESPRFVLITECLQNDFFLNNVSPVALPEATRRAILLGRRNFDLSFHHGDQLQVEAKHLKQGPLGIFLDSTIGRRRRGEAGAAVLDVINIRQWRSRDQPYDEEGRPQVYCEAGTWGAGYIDGLQQYLDPGDPLVTEEARFFEEGSVRIHHVHADSPFSFRPRREHIGPSERKLQTSALEILLDVIVQGAEADLARMRELLRRDGKPAAVFELSQEINSNESIRTSDAVYVAVIGVYTDVHVRTLLFGLRDRYVIPYLAVSDTLTAAPSIERHISGLNFAANLLDVDVIHGVNELARFLGSSPPLEDEWQVVASKPFSAYVAFDERTQRVTAQQEETLQAYLALTEGRSARVYRQIERANTFLIRWGTAFLSLTLLFVALHPFFPERIPWQLPLITGGISLAQFASAFFANPTDSLQQNLINLAALRMILESHSLKSVFARLHLSPPRMDPADTAADAERARRDAELTIIRTQALAGQLQLLNEIDTVDYEALKRFGRLQHQSPETAALELPTTDGNASTPQ